MSKNWKEFQHFSLHEVFTWYTLGNPRCCRGNIQSRKTRLKKRSRIIWKHTHYHVPSVPTASRLYRTGSFFSFFSANTNKKILRQFRALLFISNTFILVLVVNEGMCVCELCFCTVCFCEANDMRKSLQCAAHRKFAAQLFRVLLKLLIRYSANSASLNLIIRNERVPQAVGAIEFRHYNLYIGNLKWFFVHSSLRQFLHCDCMPSDDNILSCLASFSKISMSRASKS